MNPTQGPNVYCAHARVLTPMDALHCTSRAANKMGRGNVCRLTLLIFGVVPFHYQSLHPLLVYTHSLSPMIMGSQLSTTQHLHKVMNTTLPAHITY